MLCAERKQALKDRHGVLKGSQRAKQGATRGPRYIMIKDYKPLMKAGIHVVHRNINTHERKEEVFAHREGQLVNAEEMTELETHHLAAMMMVTDSRKNHQ